MNKFYCYILVAAAPLFAQTSPAINPQPSREFGQPQLLQSITSVAPNLVEGRELDNPSAIAFDTSVSPPILYVADTFNNRVLAFQNPDNFSTCGTSSASCGFASMVIGQRDLASTCIQGPGSNCPNPLSAGLLLPWALAVDNHGNLYVADAGNNRILRFPAPFKQTSSLLQADLVIGQPNVNQGNVSNQGLSAPSAKSLSLSYSNNLFPDGLAIDASGNLWVSDPGNNRVLRFPVSQLAPNTALPAADLVLGQFDFTSNGAPQAPANPPPNTGAQIYLNPGMLAPAGLAFDNNGGLYVADWYSRALYFNGPFVSGLKAQRILGVNTVVTQQGQTPPAYPNQYTLGATNTAGTSFIPSPPLGIFTNGANLFVSDALANRIVVYDVPANWPAATINQPSPAFLASVSVIGQNDSLSGKANKGQPRPDATTLSTPAGGAFLGNELWVADSANNRVLAFSPGNPLNYRTATRLIGQLDFPYNTLNLIEGREVNLFGSQGGAAGIAIDVNSTPPHLYVADTLNNRILGFNDARIVQQTSKADLVIGQSSSTDFYDSLINSPSGTSSTPNNAGLYHPIGLVVDANGNLYVADSGNGRVLRFPAPFSQPAGAPQTANLELGQPNFAQTVQNPSQANMGNPWGLALFSDGSLAVSDAAYNRVLIFQRPSGGDFTLGQSAFAVLGQPNFNSIQASTGTSTIPPSNAGMNSPRHIAADTSDRLYVTDAGNGRVLVFTNARLASNGAPSTLQIPNLNQPDAIFVSSLTGEIWVGNGGGNPPAVYRFPEYQTLISNGEQPTSAIGFQSAPLALTLDAAGNLVVAESSNRITYFYAMLTYRNVANENQAGLAPGMVTYIGLVGANFKDLPAFQAQTLPWPTSASGIQVLVNGTVAPIYAVGTPGAPYIWFEVPMSSPTSGNADVQVYRPSTGEIVADATLPFVPANPGFFTADESGNGQVQATNFDEVNANCSPQPSCYINSATNQVARGSTIIFCLTGQGYVPGAGPDGATPPTLPTPQAPVVITTAGQLPASAVTYSGLGCGYPGLWQINLQVPMIQAPGVSKIVITLNDVPSNTGPNGPLTLTTTFAVK